MRHSQLTARNHDSPVNAPRPNDSNEMAGFLAQTLRRWWFTAFLLGLITAAGAAAIVIHTFRPEYMASMWLQIYARAPYIVFPDQDDSGQFIENQTQLIRSRLVLDSLLRDSKIASMQELSHSTDKIIALASRLNVRPVGHSEYFAVEYRGIAEDTSKYVVQEVVKSYMSLQNSDESRQRQDVMTLLEDERALREQKVEETRKMLAHLVENSTIADGPKSHQTQEQMSNLAELRKRLVTLDVDSAILRIEIDAFENANQYASLQEQSQVENTSQEHAGVIAMENELAQREDKLRTLDSSGLGKNHPSYKRAQEALDVQTRRLSEVRDRVAKIQSSASQLVRKKEREHQLSTMKSKLSSFRITQGVIEAHLANETELIKQSSGDSLQIEFLRAELSQATDVHNLISRRLLALKTEQRAPARVEPLQAGGVNATPVELIPYKKIAVASGGAFLIPFTLLFMLERWMRRVSHVGQLRNTAQLRVIGEIANLPRPRLSRYIQPRRWSTEKQLYRESVDQLRTCLVCQEHDSDKKSHVLAIASAISGEGKTSLALQLSASLAASSTHRVLLVDGDIRHPKTHSLLNTELSPGLTDVLAAKSPWKDAIRKRGTDRLYCLTAGKLLASPHVVFSNNKFERLISDLRPYFQYIIIDTPPVLSASEALLMAKVADECVLCARRDRSRLDLVRAAHARLMLVGARCVGTVLTGVPFRNYSSRYGIYSYREDSGKAKPETQMASAIKAVPKLS
jgi:polysaccharide biosynthesis transport protein